MGYESSSGVVYAIRHKESGRCYVGSTISEKKRQTQHFSNLRKNRHCNVHLQRAFAKYGEDAFEWVVLENTNDLATQESAWIAKLNSVSEGFNLAVEPYAPMRGRKHSKETVVNMKMKTPRGERHHNSKYTEEQIRNVAAMHRNGVSQTEIESITGVDATNVSLVVHSKAWTHIGIEPVQGRSNNKSGCVGVYKHRSGKWIAEIIKNKKYHALGSFDNYQDAVAARKMAEGGVPSDTK